MLLPVNGGDHPMHDMLAEKLLMLERLLLKHDYHELLLRTRSRQLQEKVLRIIRLKEEQIRLLDDLLRENVFPFPTTDETERREEP